MTTETTRSETPLAAEAPQQGWARFEELMTAERVRELTPVELREINLILTDVDAQAAIEEAVEA